MFYRFSGRTILISFIFSLLYTLFLWQVPVPWSGTSFNQILLLLLYPLFVSLAIIVIGIKDLFSSKKCSTCRKDANDVLFSDHKIGSFCRNHLIEKYSDLFVKTPFNIVMIEYQPKLGAGYTTYLYDPLSELDWGDQGKIVELLTKGISDRECSQCGNRANILFIPKEVARFIQGADPSFASKGEYLCKEHALKRIIPSFQDAKQSLALYLPFKQDGLQATYY